MTRDEPDTEVLHVFLPTTPNPTSGFLLLVPRDEAHLLGMSVEEGVRLIISGGAAVQAAQAAALEGFVLSDREREGGEAS